MQVLTAAAQFVRNTLVKTPAWAAMATNETFPGASVQTTADWSTFIKTTLNSQGHTVGTCSMQPQAQGGVVDPVCNFATHVPPVPHSSRLFQSLKVYGTTNVRVVDLSVMPLQFSGHPQALVYAM